MLDERHLATAERAHDQRVPQATIQIQLRDKAPEVLRAARLLDQVDRSAFARTSYGVLQDDG